MTTRVGVVADTHCPEFLDRLPDRLFDILAGVDLILHAVRVDADRRGDRLQLLVGEHGAAVLRHRVQDFAA